MKKKLIVLCGALVLVVAAVSVTVASRGVSSISDVTMDSIEALTRYEGSAEYAPTEYDVSCYASIAIYDSWGNLIYYHSTYVEETMIECHSGHMSFCYPYRGRCY